MIHEVFPVGPLQCNCHILADESTLEAVILDPGDEPERILERAKGLTVRALLHTHGHFDHVLATRPVKEATGAEVMIHRDDRGLYEDLRGQLRMFRGLFGMDLGEGHESPAVDGFLEEGGEIAFGRHRLKVLHTPGHTPGSCCFHGDGVLFSGDTLFRRGIGRTDFPGGDATREAASIRERIYTLDPETVVYPGHGPLTHVGEERRDNPFVTA